MENPRPRFGSFGVPSQPGDTGMIHTPVFIHPSVEIGEGTVVWHLATILEGTVIGKNCVIGSSVWIGRGARIGDGVRINDKCHITNEITVGDNVFFGRVC